MQGRDRPDAHDEALLLGMARVAVGVAALLTPATAGRALFRSRPTGQARVALRLFGGREVALGLGTALAARHASPALRGWLEAGALADASDGLTAVADRRRAMRPPVRVLVGVCGLGAAVRGVMLADRLAD